MGIDAASWPPLSQRWQVGWLAAALLEGSLTGTWEDEYGGFLAENGWNQAFFAYINHIIFRALSIIINHLSHNIGEQEEKGTPGGGWGSVGGFWRRGPGTDPGGYLGGVE